MKNVAKTKMQQAIKMQLQRFADPVYTTPTDPYAKTGSSANNDRGVRLYGLQFAGMLSTIFQNRAYFGAFFGGLQTRDDISDNQAAFYLKVNNQPVIMQRYNKDENTAFGTGTGNSNRFGPRQEITYQQLAVPYTWDWAFHEGIDRATVNIDETTAVADRLALQAQAKMTLFNEAHGKFISTSAKAINTKAAGGVATQTEVVEAFNEAFETMTNLEVVGVKRAYVVPSVWNQIVDNGLATNDAKAAGVNIAQNKIYSFKDFILELIPEGVKGADSDLAYFTVDGTGYAYTGVETARTIESEDFDGKALQGRGRAGEFIPEDNKKAVLKFTVKTVAVTGVTLTPTTASVEVGKTVTLNATVAPDNATDKKVTWTSSAAATATVDGTGKVTGVAAGEATITAKAGDKTATAKVTVTATA